MLKGFKDFILRGNVIDLAVAVVIGAAFAALVGAFGTYLITPVINAIFALFGLSKDGLGGQIDIPGDQVINLGAIFNAILVFLITAAVVYFVFVAPMNAAKDRVARNSELDDEEPIDTLLLREIRDLLRRDHGLPPASSEDAQAPTA